MSILDILRESRQSSASAYHLFLLDYNQISNRVFAFFEGRDDSSFYIGFLVNYTMTADNIRNYRCGSKYDVIKTFEKVKRNPGLSNNTLFFIDKDFSDLISEKLPKDRRVYITDYYSIENHIVSKTTFRRYWNDVLSVAADIYSFDQFENQFENILSSFYTKIKPISIWMLFIRREQIKANFSNINISKLIKLDESFNLIEVSSKSWIEMLERMTSVTTPSKFTLDSPLISNELENLNPKFYVRGKFELWIFIEFIKIVVRFLSEEMRKQGRRLSIRTQLNLSNSIEILGPRCDIPSSLQDFLKYNLVTTKKGFWVSIGRIFDRILIFFRK